MSYGEAARMRRAHDEQVKEWQALCAEQMAAIHALQRDNAALRGMVKQLAAMADQQDELLASALQLAEKAVNG